MLGRLFEAPRPIKRAISLTYDATALAFAFYLALCLRLGTINIPIGIEEILSFTITLAISLAVFTQLGLYRAILRFMAQQALVSVAAGVVVSAIALATSSFYLQANMPRSVPIIFGFAALFFVGTPRLLIRNIVLMLKNGTNGNRDTVIIYGAGHSGFQLASALQGSPYKVVGFVDDNSKLHGKLFRGLTVFNPAQLSNLKKTKSLKHILLALGNAPRSKRAEVLKRLEPLEISTKTIPAMDEVVCGKSRIEDIKDVAVEDLLGRDPVKPNIGLLGACIKGKNVLVTGAGGSIGSELCRQIIKQAPRRIVLFELNEYNLYKLEQELQELLLSISYKIELISLIGSVQNQEQMSDAFSTFKIHTVYHAAAYKHVPLIEQNIIEGVKNNVFGTWHCAEAAIKANVESFVLVSTDKAVRPTNIMGATKRIAELVLQALAQRQQTTRFTMVRFGNVLGSSGSVVPLFRKQIKNGGPVTVTHPEITRYFMTIPEAAELVLQAGSMGKGGDVFVLDMGESVQIVELAKNMIHLSGLTLKDETNPEGDIEIRFTGLRPGEKLFEELLIGEDVTGTEHSRILRAEEAALRWEEMAVLLSKLDHACEKFACDKVHELLLDTPTGYQPDQDALYDSTWQVKRRSAQTSGRVVQLEAGTAKYATP